MICYGFTLFFAVMLITRLINCIDNDWKRTALKGILLIVTVPVGILELFVMYNYGAVLGAGVVGALLETNFENWGFGEQIVRNLFYQSLEKVVKLCIM